jgi:hypothetical protein
LTQTTQPLNSTRRRRKPLFEQREAGETLPGLALHISFSDDFNKGEKIMPNDPALCLSQLENMGLTPACQALLPTSFNCEEVLDDAPPRLHQICMQESNCFPIVVIICQNQQTGEARYFPYSTAIKQCMALNQQDPNWQMAQCYCCCPCIGEAAQVAVPDGAVPADTIGIGQGVLAASIEQPGDGLRLKWSETKVYFSQGTGSGGHQSPRVSVTFGTDENQKLICSVDQPFLLANGKLTTGGKLRPGQQLVDKDGQPQEIKTASVGTNEGGVHHIATTEPWKNSPDGHLLLTAGVVTGDFTLQMYYSLLPDSMKEENYDDSTPVPGTASPDETP